jgi:deazaflavin-dependent oxidoreductase (nitroreductase family)
MRPFTMRFVNPLTIRVAGHLPAFGILGYVGRRTGRRYRIPMNVFRTPDGGWVLALTYGADVDWVKNVLAAGICDLRTRGRDFQLVDPKLVHDPERRLMPEPVRTFLGLMNVEHFLRLRTAPPPPDLRLGLDRRGESA